MKVILLEDVKALGKKGQIVKINDGYVRNFVLPKKLGVEVTSKNLNDLKLQKANEEKLAKELARVNGMLANEKFVSKAPQAKIDEEKAKQAKYAQMMEQVKERLAQLGQ